MKGNGASLSFKGPLSLVCRAAGEKRNTLLHNLSAFPHRTIYYKQCFLPPCFIWIGPRRRSPTL